MTRSVLADTTARDQYSTEPTGGLVNRRRLGHAEVPHPACDRTSALHFQSDGIAGAAVCLPSTGNDGHTTYLHRSLTIVRSFSFIYSKRRKDLYSGKCWRIPMGPGRPCFKEQKWCVLKGPVNGVEERETLSIFSFFWTPEWRLKAYSFKGLWPLAPDQGPCPCRQ